LGQLGREFGKRNLTADVRRDLLDGWRRAGLPVPENPPPMAAPMPDISG
jgi:hypothetical protein